MSIVTQIWEMNSPANLLDQKADIALLAVLSARGILLMHAPYPNRPGYMHEINKYSSHFLNTCIFTNYFQGFIWIWF